MNNPKVKINVFTQSGTIRPGRNMFRFQGELMSVNVVAGDETYGLIEVRESEFDLLDILRLGCPDRFCQLATGLAAVWPTPDKETIIEVKAFV